MLRAISACCLCAPSSCLLARCSPTQTSSPLSWTSGLDVLLVIRVNEFFGLFFVHRWEIGEQQIQLSMSPVSMVSPARSMNSCIISSSSPGFISNGGNSFSFCLARHCTLSLMPSFVSLTVSRSLSAHASKSLWMMAPLRASSISLGMPPLFGVYGVQHILNFDQPFICTPP